MPPATCSGQDSQLWSLPTFRGRPAGVRRRPRGPELTPAASEGHQIPPGPSQQQAHGCSHVIPAEPIPPGAERSASAALALPFPYTYLTSWTQEFNLACLPLPTDLRIQPEPVRHTSCSSPRVRSSAIEPLPGERGVLISITSSPKAPTAVFPARKERDQIKQQDELRVQKSAAWDSESKGQTLGYDFQQVIPSFLPQFSHWGGGSEKDHFKEVSQALIK